MARMTNKELQNLLTLAERQVEVLKEQCEISEDQFKRLRDDYKELMENREKTIRENNELSETIAIYEEQLKDLRNTRAQLEMAEDAASQAEHNLEEAESAVLVLSRLLAEERVL